MSRLKPSVSGKPPSRKTPFQPAHALQYELVVAMRDTHGVVCSVRCQFCQFFGREEAATGKRKRTQNTKFYKAPSLPQYYVDHNTSAHTVKWEAYKALNDADKATFFDGQTSRSNQLSSHFERDSSVLRFDIPESIVKNLIGKLFFNLEDEHVSVATALRVFGQSEGGVHTVTIKNPLRFSLAIQHLGVGLSFRQTAAVMQQTHKAIGNPQLYGMTATLVSSYARFLVAHSFQQIGKLMADSNMWGFAFACDLTTHTDRSFMDQRVRLAVNGVLVNLHVLAIPVFNRHTAAVQVQLIVAVLDILYAQWRDKLIGIASDGENTMTGRHGGVVTLLEAEATHPILRVWCAAHQMNLVMKAAFAIVGDGNFVKKTKDLIVHLRRQKNLIAEMGGAAKKLTNRWLYMGNAMRWILQHRVRLAEHFDQNGSMLPLPEWWVNAAVVNGITAVVNVTFVKIQAKEIILSQQMAEIDILVVRLRSLLSVQPVVDGTFAHGENDTVSEKYWLKEQHLVNFIKDQGSYVTTYLDTMQPDEKQSMLKVLGKFVLHVIERMELVQAERNSNNEAAELVAPPVMPSKLAQIPPREFVSDLLDPHRIRLAKFWSQAQIEAVESEHRDLCQADMLNDSVKST